MAHGVAAVTGRRGPGPAEAVAAVVAVVAMDLAIRAVLPEPGSRLEALGRVAAVRTAQLAVGTAWWGWRGWTPGDLGLTGPRARKGLVTGIAWAAGFGTAVAAVEVLGRAAGAGSFLAAVAGGGPRVAGVHLAALSAVGAGIAPVFEEFLFRGVLYGGLRRRLGPVAATALVTAVFAAGHLATTRVPWTQAVGGILFCAAYERSGSLWAPVILHAAGNLALFLAPSLLILFP